ncbi:MAG: HAMP domain-containing sensor histidine kinase [Algibacter sp.]|uniref:sensor histidine kinase n=1 Tax=Algibacter sp. TaxID=1872428 RepID=UPI003296DA4B
MSLVTISISLFFIVYETLFSWPTIIILFGSIVFVTSSISLILNFRKQFKIAIINYLVSAFIIIFTTPILLGPNLHYQYFFVCLIGLPFILIKKENKLLRRFLSILPIVLWAYLEFHFIKFEPVFHLPEDYVYLIRALNDFLMFVIVFCLFYAFMKENDTHLNALEDKTLKLTDSYAKLGQFSYIVSHDLKSPLNNIDSLITIIQEEHSENLDEEGMELVSMIRECAIHMRTLVTTILEYSRAEEGIVNVTTFNSIELFKAIPLLINIPENITLQYPNNTAVIQGSYSQLEQVLINLISNAVKYHDKEHGLIKLTITPLNSEFLKFEVIDDGPGIKPKFHDIIFEMFGTANEEFRPDSSGFGLSIVKKLVTLNHGQIGLKSVYGSGSCFWFTWPLKRVSK